MKSYTVFPLSILSPYSVDTFCKNSVVIGIPFCIPRYCSGKENIWLGTPFVVLNYFEILSYENSINQKTCHTPNELLAKAHKLGDAFDSSYEDCIHFFLEECAIIL